MRSNLHGNVGFLADSRRVNVAVTRAKRHLCVVCDSGTVSNDPFVASLVEHLENHGIVRSASEYGEEFIGYNGGGRDASVGIGAKKNQRESKGQGKGITGATVNKQELDEWQNHSLQSWVEAYCTGSLRGGRLVMAGASDNYCRTSSTQAFLALSGDSVTSDEVLCFPASLTAHHRAIVHEAVELMGTGAGVVREHWGGYRALCHSAP